MSKTAGIIVMLASCAGVRDERGGALGQDHAEPARADHAPLRTKMRDHGDELRQIDALLLRGQLAEARAVAFWLERRAPDESIAEGARRVARARSTSEGIVFAAQVAGRCGSCHARMDVSSRFERDVVAPDEGPARHVWAAERLWDGVVGASEPQWRLGLGAFSRDLVGYRVATIASRALVENADRGETYGLMRMACMTCHAVQDDRPARVAADRR